MVKLHVKHQHGNEIVDIDGTIEWVKEQWKKGYIEILVGDETRLINTKYILMATERAVTKEEPNANDSDQNRGE